MRNPPEAVGDAAARRDGAGSVSTPPMNTTTIIQEFTI